MRILAIRGENLASLAGPFAVELAEGPLAGAGLFAITGPTGAGKSTILDALCLALYDTLPRLPGRGRGGEIGARGSSEELRVRADDVRSILRHGCGEGSAEVDFRGVDSAVYRARWQLRRARRRPNGRLQNQEMELVKLSDGSVFAGGKTEIKELIAERLGLSFDQFRRSVLLAQGDFAAFLRADQKERSELLERITGSEIYSRLSVASHRREAAARGAREVVAARLGDHSSLDEAARSALEARRRSLGEDTAAAEEAVRHWQQVHECFARRQQLAAALATAEAALSAAEGAWAEAAERRLVLHTVKAVERHRHVVEAADLSQREKARARASLADAEDALSAQSTALAARSDALEAAREALRAATRDELEARPRLARARLLEDRCSELRSAIERSTASHQQAASEAAATSAQLSERRRMLRELEELAHDHQSWCEAHPQLHDLGRRWDRWQLILTAFAKAAGELTELGAQHGAAQHREDELAQQLAETSAGLEQAVATLHGARATAAERSAEAAAVPLDELATRRHAAEDQRQILSRQHELAGAALRLRADLASLAAEHVTVAAEHRSTAEQLAEMDRQLPLLRAALAEAQRQHRLTLAACKEDLGELRDALEAGVPCPLCGSTTHPWVREMPALSRLAQHGEERLGELAEQVETAVGEQRALATALAALGKQKTKLETRQGATTAELDEVIATWRELPLAADELATEPGHEELVQRLADALDASTRKLDEIRRQERRGHELRQLVDDARRASEAARDAEQRAREEHAELEQKVAAARSARAALADALRRARDDRDRSWSELAAVVAAIPELPREAPDDAQPLIDQCHAWAAAWCEHDSALAEAHRRCEELAAPLAGAESAARHADSRADELARELADQEGRLAAAAAEVDELTQGRGAAELERRLSAELEAARHADSEAREAQHEAGRLVAAAEGATASARENLETRQAELAARQDTLAETLTATGLEEAELRRLLAHDDQWQQTEESALTQLSEARDEQRVLVEERRARLAEHEQQTPPGGSAEEAAAAVATASAELTTLREALTEAQLQLRRDDDARRQLTELARELDETTAQWQLWASLKELIGSADGSRFRGFAQSLTLSSLLAHANHHLHDLARRYHLERVPGAELELQVVDRDMADEVRSVFSLSGGESFLVSLALALGLASLSARSTRVESLFIDEGFGSLDTESLETAVASLDALQSLGRQVGVISHVATMVERIGFQVRVERRGGGRSSVTTVSA